MPTDPNIAPKIATKKMTAQMASDAKLDSKSISPGCTWFVHMATTAQIIAILKNTNPRPKIQKVTKPSPTQIQPAVTAEDFGTGGRIGSGGGFIYSARFSAGSIRTSMTEVFFMTYNFLRNFFEHEVVTPQLCVLHDPLSSLPTCRFLRDTSLYGGINR